MVDPSLWSPACKEAGYRGLSGVQPTQQPLFDEVLEEFLAAALEIPEGDLERAKGGTASERRAVVSRMFAAQPSRGEGRGALGLRGGRVPSESRMVDGLTTPDCAPTRTFYDEAYTTDVGTVEFCMALPGNPLGLLFEEWSLGHMCAECVLKVCCGAFLSPCLLPHVRQGRPPSLWQVQPFPSMRRAQEASPH